MKWGLVIANRARHAMRDMPRAEAEQIDAALMEMRDDPYAGDIRFLKGTDRALRRRVGAWRIMYEVRAHSRVLSSTTSSAEAPIPTDRPPVHRIAFASKCDD
jgi:mRNA-degrading endonuclease RelE of RelBE toxin-antitoxin system